jgi:hypothetical protein
MHKLDQKGSLLVPLILVSLLMLGALGFGAWAFAGRQEYKNNVDSKIAEAVEVANEKISLEKEAEFAERDKQPFKTYQGPSAFGALKVPYPRTWSAYIVEAEAGNAVVNGYLHPNFVPDIKSDTSFALRFEVLSSAYDAEVRKFETKIKTGKITAASYRAPKVQEASGLLLSGEIDVKKSGTMVLLPVRDKTIRIWTEGQDFKGDFDTMLNELTFNL